MFWLQFLPHSRFRYQVTRTSRRLIIEGDTRKEITAVQHIQLNDQLYLEAQRRAATAGFPSVDEYVADILHHELLEETENFDHLFTPERLAHIDRADAQIDAGHGITSEQVREHFRRKRDA
jgi:hypothetical protein